MAIIYIASSYSDLHMHTCGKLCVSCIVTVISLSTMIDIHAWDGICITVLSAYNNMFGLPCGSDVLALWLYS